MLGHLLVVMLVVMLVVGPAACRGEQLPVRLAGGGALEAGLVEVQPLHCTALHCYPGVA
jgi:hypothetical protein